MVLILIAALKLLRRHQLQKEQISHIFMLRRSAFIIMTMSLSNLLLLKLLKILYLKKIAKMNTSQARFKIMIWSTITKEYKKEAKITPNLSYLDWNLKKMK